MTKTPELSIVNLIRINDMGDLIGGPTPTGRRAKIIGHADVVPSVAIVHLLGSWTLEASSVVLEIEAGALLRCLEVELPPKWRRLAEVEAQVAATDVPLPGF